jgi:hypothetical protein
MTGRRCRVTAHLYRTVAFGTTSFNYPDKRMHLHLRPHGDAADNQLSSDERSSSYSKHCSFGSTGEPKRSGQGHIRNVRKMVADQPAKRIPKNSNSSNGGSTTCTPIIVPSTPEKRLCKTARKQCSGQFNLPRLAPVGSTRIWAVRRHQSPLRRQLRRQCGWPPCRTTVPPADFSGSGNRFPGDPWRL